MSDAEEKITLTADELAARIDRGIAERAAQREREAARIWELQNPTPTPARSINAPQEVVGEFSRILDAARGDVDAAYSEIVRRLRVDMHGRPTDPDFKALFYTWEFARDHFYVAALIGSLLLRIQSVQRAKAEAV